MFQSELYLRTHRRPKMWVTTQECIWQDAVFGRVVLPVGFITDLASTPQFLHISPDFDPDGLSRRAAAFHDGGYARLWGWTKDVCDRFLRAALIADGASVELAEMFYQGVHLCGQSHWESDAGALETEDFDTPEHFRAWHDSASPIPAATTKL